jgi:Uma2 family endonuclease
MEVRTDVILEHMPPEPPVKPPQKVATYDDLLAVPDHQVAEILDGELHVTPRPSPRHAFSTSELHGFLSPAFGRRGDEPGGWLLLFEPELHLGADVCVPDLAGWRRERLPSAPEEAFISVAPDWVCEVLSPSTEHLDRLKKLRIYAREEVPHVWLINPIARTFENLRLKLKSGHWVILGTYTDDEVVKAEPFGAVPLDLSRLWWS